MTLNISFVYITYGERDRGPSRLTIPTMKVQIKKRASQAYMPKRMRGSYTLFFPILGFSVDLMCVDVEASKLKHLYFTEQIRAYTHTHTAHGYVCMPWLR